MKKLGMCSLEKRRLKGGNLITVFKYAKDCYKEDGDRLFCLSTEGRTRTNGLNLQQGRFRLVIRKNFLTVRVVKLWNRL